MYQASGRVGNSATMKMKFRFTFFNLYDTTLNLLTYVKRIEVQGAPPVWKKGASVLINIAKCFPFRPPRSFIPLLLEVAFIYRRRRMTRPFLQKLDLARVHSRLIGL